MVRALDRLMAILDRFLARIGLKHEDTAGMELATFSFEEVPHPSAVRFLELDHVNESHPRDRMAKGSTPPPIPRDARKRKNKKNDEWDAAYYLSVASAEHRDAHCRSVLAEGTTSYRLPDDEQE